MQNIAATKRIPERILHDEAYMAHLERHLKRKVGILFIENIPLDKPFVVRLRESTQARLSDDFFYTHEKLYWLEITDVREREMVFPEIRYPDYASMTWTGLSETAAEEYKRRFTRKWSDFKEWLFREVTVKELLQGK